MNSDTSEFNGEDNGSAGEVDGGRVRAGSGVEEQGSSPVEAWHGPAQLERPEF